MRTVFVAALFLCAVVHGQEPKKEERPPNRLGKEKSPYLLQHARNPVDWYPWGEEAFKKAKAEDKPVFLSIGYATCHWCHVMERESFENEEVAAYMNEHYVAIKVDREERPDVDEVYMSAVQAMTGAGGWPLSVFLTPGARPFTGGTYFPQPARYGRRSFLEVLKLVHELWTTKRGEIDEGAGKITAHLEKINSERDVPTKLGPEVLTKGKAVLAQAYDAARGGFPGAGPTKFPMPHVMSFLLRYYQRTGDVAARDMALSTLNAIAHGGLRDHLAGGFHRYSVDREWAIPHFEKMLYDQAGLVRAFVEAFQVSHREEFADVARETLEFVLARMRSSEGAFTSAWDADSEGVEGKCYVWTPAEIAAALGPDAGLFSARYGVSEHGNFSEFPGKTHLQLDASLADLVKNYGGTEAELEKRLAEDRAKLLVIRDRRVQPLHDDKVLVDWNGLMIGAAAYAARGLGEPRYAAAASKAAEFLLSTLRTKDGRLLHRYRAGEAAIPGMLEDYAFFVWGLVELFETTQEPRWLEAATALARVMIEDLWDAKGGGFFHAPKSSGLILNPKPTYDGAIPSGNGAAALALARLGHLTGERAFSDKAEATLNWYSHTIAAAGGQATALGLQVLDLLLGPRREVVLVGAAQDPELQAMLGALRAAFRPRTVVIVRPPGDAAALVKLIPFVQDQVQVDGKVTAYVCADFACKAPVTTVEALKVALAPTRPEK